MRRVVILGSGRHAKVVIDALRTSGGYEIAGCIADDTDPGRLVTGVPIIGPMDRIESLRRQGLAAVMGVGGWTDNRARRQLFDRAMGADVEILSAVHPAAVISPSATIGAGSVVLAGAVVGPEVVLGQDVIMYTNASVDHESVVGDHSLISIGVAVGGNVSMGAEVLVAIGAVIASRVTVGAGALVAAGAVVVRDVAPGTRVGGVPARPF